MLNHAAIGVALRARFLRAEIGWSLANVERYTLLRVN
jgi:hypothetical protein